MALENRTRSGIQGGSVTAKSISFTNNIERFVGRSSNSEGRIAATDVIDFDIDLGEIEEPEKFANAVGYIEPERLAWYERAAATICVGFTSIVSGVADVVESVVDGGAYLVAGAMSLVGADDAANSVREFIQTSWVDEANKAFYEGTEIGRNINQASVMAYDSDAAMGIRNTSAKVTKFVAETALSMVPGAGPVLAASFGALSAMGEASENVYVTKGIDNVTLGDNLKVLGSGVAGAIEGYSMGKMGSTAFTQIRNMTGGRVISLGKAIWNGAKNFDLGSAAQAGWNTIKSGSTWGRAVGGAAEDIFAAAGNWIDTGNFDSKEWLGIGEKVIVSVGFQSIISFGTTGIASGNRRSMQRFGEGSKVYSSYDEYLKDTEVQREEWRRSLSPEEERFIRNYTSEGAITSPGSYESVNGLLRGSMIDANAHTVTIIGTSGVPDVYSFTDFEAKFGISVIDFQQMQLDAASVMNDAIGRSTLPQDTILTRGVNYDALAQYGVKPGDTAEEIARKLLKAGGVYTDNAFMSTSVVPTGITNGKPIILELNCAAGTSGVNLEGLSHYAENEVLLNSGQSFEIFGVEIRDGKIVILLNN